MDAPQVQSSTTTAQMKTRGSPGRPTGSKNKTKKEVSQNPVTVKDVIDVAIENSNQTLVEIAHRAGFNSHHTLSMVRSGKTKLALDRAKPLAEALNIDPAMLVRMLIQERLPEVWELAEEMFNTSFQTRAEHEIIRMVRMESEGLDVRPQTESQIRAFKQMIAEWKKAYIDRNTA